MQLSLDTRLRALVRRLPPVTPMRAGEIAATALVAGCAARLLWAVVTPVTPAGAWMPAAPAPAGLAVGFDPFFRNAPQTTGPAVVTTLAFRLFGIRLNEASGGGSAIIEVPDDGQRSYAVGDEIQPGVTLKAVAFDHVVLSRGGADEQLYIDQSDAGAGTASGTPAAGADISDGDAGPGIETLAGAVAVTPRRQDGQVTGVTIRPGADAAAFAASGLQAGDVLIRINGERVAGIEDIAAIAARAADGRIVMDVERGGQRITVSRSLAQ